MGENYFKSGTVVCLNKLLIFKNLDYKISTKPLQKV